MSYYKTYKFKSGTNPSPEQHFSLKEYNQMINNPPNVLFASNEELDSFYSEKIVLELELMGLIEVK